jgi:hypothetical protein
MGFGFIGGYAITPKVGSAELELRGGISRGCGGFEFRDSWSGGRCVEL